MKELNIAKELWRKHNNGLTKASRILSLGWTHQHLQTCERWLEFLNSYKKGQKRMLTYQFIKLYNKIKDLEQTIKYHKSKLGELK
ncbi:MAG TPA: hypothetical protein VI815_04050 [Candidatus Nanoarchaeia archaeon]|nr:hypothetical protein [Candidatus Nanoarchaeia archaeon]